MAISLQALQQSIDSLLEPERFRDYCPNGLQVEGRSEVKTLVTGVTASQALIDGAITANADAILVHHGWFWKGENERITGMKKQRLKALLAHDISLLAYHLPLDAHPLVGNNATLGQRLDFTVTGEMAEGVGNFGELSEEMLPQQLSAKIQTALNREPLWIGDAKQEIKTVAWCTGAAQNYIEQAVDAGVDAFITGEVSEQTVHIARECGITFFAAGHHATERYGVQALGEYLQKALGITHQFIDVDNPV